jgi:uncharacterized protein with HEPN domain
MYDQKLSHDILTQILEASGRIKRRFAVIQSSDDFLANDDGIDRLDAICMMLIAIGESLKYLDKIIGGKLFEDIRKLTEIPFVLASDHVTGPKKCRL